MKCSKCGTELRRENVKGNGSDWCKAGAGLFAATVATGGLGLFGSLAYAGKKIKDSTQIRVKCPCCGKDHHINKNEFNNLK